MPERLLLLGLVALLLVAAWGGVRLWRALRVRRLRAATPLAAVAPLGRPAVVAFSAPGCSDCHYRQAPAMHRLAARLGDGVTLRTLSALEHPALVEQLGILTVPSTVVVDARGQVRHLNLGYASDVTLDQQVRAVA